MAPSLSSAYGLSASAREHIASNTSSAKGLPSPDSVRSEFLRRNPCTVDVRKLQHLLDHDNHKMRDELRAFLCSRDFAPVYNISLEDERALALRRLQLLTHNPGRFISVKDFLHNAHRVFAAHEIIGLADGSLATKLTVQFNLAGGTVLKLGTERHHALVDDIDSLASVGCFALTELSYGNNAVVMETTAHFDATREEFIINTPTTGAQKYWITNSALHANFAVVFAQLVLNGTSQGVHAFIVPIRDKQKNACPGVFIRDMGHKIGCNGVDNGCLAFHNVRVPRTALLNRYSDVSPEGVFTSTTRGKRALFIKVADQLLSGRLCISAMMIGTAKLSLVIATRYAISRLAVGPSGSSDKPLLDLQFQRRTLAPLVARVYACAIALNYAKDRYVALQNTSDDDWREAVVLCCAIKPLVTWTTERVVSVLRERCGGQGYLSSNRFGHFIGFAHAGITAEGDDAVLMTKTSKELLEMVAQRRLQLPRPAAAALHTSRPMSTEWVGAALATRETCLVTELRKIMTTATKNRTIYDTWMMKKSGLVQKCAIAHIEMLAFERMTAVQSQVHDAWIGLLQTLYGLDVIQKDLGWFVTNGIISNPVGCRVEDVLSELSVQVGGQLPYLVNAFGIPDGLVHAPIAGDWINANALPAPFARM